MTTPDTAALVAELRGAASMFAEDPDGTAWVVTPDTTLLADLRAAVAQLRQLDRIKAALGPVSNIRRVGAQLPDCTSYSLASLGQWLTALADALEADDGA